MPRLSSSCCNSGTMTGLDLSRLSFLVAARLRTATTTATRVRAELTAAATADTVAAVSDVIHESVHDRDDRCSPVRLLDSLACLGRTLFAGARHIRVRRVPKPEAHDSLMNGEDGLPHSDRGATGGGFGVGRIVVNCT